MPLINQRIGVPNIFLGVTTNTALPSLSTMAFTACSVAPNDLLINDINQTLLSTDTYQVAIGLVGRDALNGGYTVGPTTISSGNVTVTTGNVIQVHATSAALLGAGANYINAVGMAVFLKINNADFQLAHIAYVDPFNDFYSSIAAKPLRVAQQAPIGVLNSSATDSTFLGSRAPMGYTYLEVTPTTGTFNFRKAVQNVTVSPNNSTDFQVATARSTNIRFQSLNNSIKTFVQAAAGIFISTPAGATNMQQTFASLNTAQALLKGNIPCQVYLPGDPATGLQELKLLVGLLTVNSTELDTAWSKTAPTPVSFQFDAAPMDYLITNQHTEVGYVYGTPN